MDCFPESAAVFTVGYKVQCRSGRGATPSRVPRPMPMPALTVVHRRPFTHARDAFSGEPVELLPSERGTCPIAKSISLET